MIWLRLFIPLAVFLLGVLLQLFGIIDFTKHKIDPGKALIPLYYWFKKTNKKQLTTKNAQTMEAINKEDLVFAITKGGELILQSQGSMLSIL